MAALNESTRELNLTAKTGQAHGLQAYGNAQDLIETLLAALTDPDNPASFIVLTHDQLIEHDDGNKLLPSVIGKAASTKIPQLFNTILRYEVSATDNSVKRRIKTQPTLATIAKTEVPSNAVPASYPIEDGLAPFFQLAFPELCEAAKATLKSS
jgi:hypothetical protein